jgi:hypothetical protein
MRVLAIARFRLLTIVRSGTPMFVVAALPPLLAAIPLSASEPWLRHEALRMLGINARAAVFAWLLHAILVGLTGLASGTVRTPHKAVTERVLPDLMDTAPIEPSARFWGEALGTLGAMAIVHVCCLPLLAAVAALSPMPTAMFLRIEAGTLAIIVLAGAGAAWQRRAPRTKYSASRGPRNAILFGIFLLLILRYSTARWEAFRDALFQFASMRTSMQGWTAVVNAVGSPLLLVTLLSLLYAGYIAYYYMSSTRKRVWEN